MDTPGSKVEPRLFWNIEKALLTFKDTLQNNLMQTWHNASMDNGIQVLIAQMKDQALNQKDMKLKKWKYIDD